ncbi:MAG: hypothetical protein ACKVII_25320, partial [Planctomycetales bacterium]
MVCLLWAVVSVACIRSVVADEAPAKLEQARAAVAKIKRLELPVEQRRQVLARWFKFGGSVARQQCNEAIGASNFVVAEEWASKEYQLASDCFEASDKTRVASLMNLAKVRFLQQDKSDAALST